MPAGPHVVALYRYPVKGLTPEPRERLTLRADGRVEGDRVLGFRFADTPYGDDEWSPKAGMLVLMNTPGLARLHVAFDDMAHRLRISAGGAVLAEEGLDAEGRARLAAAMEAFALGLAESPLRGHPERLPLRLVGNAVTPRYQDNPHGLVTLHSRASLAAVAAAFADRAFDERRFRSNVVIDGVEAWEEQSWAGRRVAIGGAVLAFDHPAVRCLATHANPVTGERDRQVLTTLTHAFGQEQPTFAVHLRIEQPGDLHVGDPVRLL